VTPHDDGTAHAALRRRLAGERGVIMIIGGPDTGKTSFARRLLADAVAMGRVAAFVDADTGQSTVGPPACVGMKWIDSPAALDDLTTADEIRFVGSTTPQGVVLQEVVATAALVDLARRKADLVVLDTTGTVSGVAGQTLKYHKVELCAPTEVVAIQRGSEMEPIAGMLRRFLGSKVTMIEPDAGMSPVSPVVRREERIEAFRRALPVPLERWRVHPSVFAPTLPEGFDLSRLDRMLVGIQNGQGACLGLGVLEHGDGLLRVATAHGDEMEGLRLGSMQVDLETFDTSKVRLRQLIFGV
jgi:polynucleotide 5'-hydroxyl-kinase GRC3/NOL9